MFLYTAIFIACLFVAIVIPLLYRMISHTGKVIHQTIHPGSANDLTGHLEISPVRSFVKDSAVPWNLIGNDTPGALATAYALHPEVGNELRTIKTRSGSADKISRALRPDVRMKSAGCHHRKDEATPIGNTYKVTRRKRVREPNPKYISKPASWK